MKIGTHSGQFHCDDAMAIAILRLINSAPEIHRSRDPAVLAGCDILVDVGGLYDGPKQDGPQEHYDHHQVRNAAELARPNGVPYAAAGLVWRSYGLRICNGDQAVADRVDRLIQAIDAADTGFELVSDRTPKIEGVFGFSFSAAIAALNPGWDEDGSPMALKAGFMRAVELCAVQLDRAIASATSAAAAEKLVLESEQKFEGRVLILGQYCPWVETVFQHKLDDVLYAVYKDRDGKHMVQCCPDALGSFGKRRALPEAWAGKRDEALAELTGVEDAVFCHPGRFVGGAVSLEGALRLAELAIA